jgi:hypothetical protein
MWRMTVRTRGGVGIKVVVSKWPQQQPFSFERWHCADLARGVLRSVQLPATKLPAPSASSREVSDML